MYSTQNIFGWITVETFCKKESFLLQLSRGKKSSGAAGPGQPDVYLVPELCSMTGLTDEMRNDRRVMQDLAQYTRVSPDKRVENGRKYLQNISE